MYYWEIVLGFYHICVNVHCSRSSIHRSSKLGRWSDEIIVLKSYKIFHKQNDTRRKSDPLSQKHNKKYLYDLMKTFCK